jgi:hypothetical protein
MNDCKCPGCEANRLMEGVILAKHDALRRAHEASDLAKLNSLCDELQAAWKRYGELRVEIAECAEGA